MGEPQVAIMRARQLHKRFCMQVYGGQHCTRIPRHIVRHVMHVKELKDHHEEMSYHYTLRWAEAQPVKDCTGAMATKFLFEYVLTRFGYLKVLMSDKGTHFLNETISVLIEEFQVYHQKSTPYHLQANETVEAFNKILENVLTKIYKAAE
eukprot:PITA_26283